MADNGVARRGTGARTTMLILSDPAVLRIGLSAAGIAALLLAVAARL
ncbi:hypothetical protein GCM10020358_81230 [Amorphoplanes nipponensis]|uniref:Uncharacterized protein n=1 Tax=Actinoplanes nipponensis TaxID=135950 RepID=A0A919JB17_9ACTN|nr:hypothetical protein [Actinoplanes nipponensis]GIE47684.1 hypothetical protein Ani05nite_12180 [Actinoplanes nipponensis]